MDRSIHYQNPDYLRSDQYKDSRNLGDRAQLHLRYSNNPVSWFSWVFTLLELQPGYKVLECGSGPGWLWRNNLEEIPRDCQIMVTDLSPGMIDEAQNALSTNDHSFKFRSADIRNLPFEDNSFDIVIANHMLYHVPDLDQGLAEVQRVLKSKGYLVASTVGDGHMGELSGLVRQLSPTLLESQNPAKKTVNSHIDSFSIETGRSKLEPRFSKIERFLYQSTLEITVSKHILSYILSSSEVRELVDETMLKNVTSQLDRHIIEQGAFRISTNSGLFRAQHPK